MWEESIDEENAEDMLMELEPSEVQLLSACFTHGNLILKSEWGQTDLKGVISVLVIAKLWLLVKYTESCDVH